MKIVFLCPPVSVINGGIKHIFRMAETLIAQGRDAVVFEQSGQRPSWFASTAPVVGQSIFKEMGDDVYVLPEDQPNILADFARIPNRKIIYSQNHFYGALGLAAADGRVRTLADYGVSAILCSSKTIHDHCRRRHPSLPAFIVPCAVDPALFPAVAPAQKRRALAFMPRKRPLEAIYIRDMLRFLHPAARDWEWLEVNNVSEAEAGRRMGEAAVFLSLSRLEGFGLTPLEAMSSGCVVAGFTGQGGRDYATPENGFWVNEDDLDGCAEALARALTLSQSTAADRQDYAEAAARTVAAFTPATFADGVRAAWDAILSR